MEASQPKVHVLTKDSFNVKIEEVICSGYGKVNILNDFKIRVTFDNDRSVHRPSCDVPRDK